MRRAFTVWYVKRGYKFTHCGGRSHWLCPALVRPLLFLFSPSVYCAEVFGKSFSDGFKQAFKDEERSEE